MGGASVTSSFELFDLEMSDSTAAPEERPAVLDALALEAHEAAHALLQAPPGGAASCAAWMALAEAALAVEPQPAQVLPATAAHEDRLAVIARSNDHDDDRPLPLPAPARAGAMRAMLLLLAAAAAMAMLLAACAALAGQAAPALEPHGHRIAPLPAHALAPPPPVAAGIVADEALLGSLDALEHKLSRLGVAAAAALEALDSVGAASASYAAPAEPEACSAPRATPLLDSLAPALAAAATLAAWRLACGAEAMPKARPVRARRVARITPARKALRTPSTTKAAPREAAAPPPTPARVAEQHHQDAFTCFAPQPEQQQQPGVVTFAAGRLAARREPVGLACGRPPRPNAVAAAAKVPLRRSARLNAAAN